MRWSFFCGITITVIVIFWLEWRKLKQNPKRDRAAFVTLLILIWLMSMMDIINMPGPNRMLAFIFKPLMGLVQQ